MLQPDFQRFFNQSLDLLAIVDGDAVLCSVNPAWERVLGYSAEELVGQPFMAFIHEDDRDATWARAVDTAEGDATVDFENRWRHRDGGWVRIRWTVVPDAERECFYAVGRDLSEKRRYESLLAQQEDRLASILNAAVDAIILASEDGVIRSVNPAACRLFGYTPEELEGQNLSLLMPDTHARRHDGFIRRYVETEESEAVGKGRELLGVRKDGTGVPIYLSLSATRVGGTFFFTGIIRDLTEAKARERAAREEEAARRAAEIQVALAGELHDGLLQIMAGSMMQLRTVERILATDPEAAETRLRAVREAIGAEQKSIRLFVELFRDPEAMVEEGVDLKAALAELARRIANIWGIQLDVNATGATLLSAAQRRELLRVVQEAASNSARHGKATRITLSVAVEEESAHIRITDNGGGFDWEGSLKHEALRAQRRGPMSLRRRVESMGGRMDIHSSASGVTLDLDVPLTPSSSGPGPVGSPE